MSKYDVLCFAPVRAELLARCANDRRTFVLEEPRFDSDRFRLETRRGGDGVVVATPHLPAGTPDDVAEIVQRHLVDELVAEHRIERPVLWYGGPRALPFSHHLRSRAVVFECTTPIVPTDHETLLLRRADLVIAGGEALAEHLRGLHHHVLAAPSPVDVARLASAHARRPPWPRPVVGYAGVVDARVDLALVDAVAAARPDLDLVMLGPVVGTDAASLPSRPNLRWLGRRPRHELAAHLAGWDVAMLPLVRGDLTRFLGPAAAAEPLAAGLPVVSTSVRDVVRPFAEHGLAWIGDTAPAFAAAIDNALAEDRERRRARALAFLAERGWDEIWADVWAHVELAVAARTRRARLTGTGTHAFGSALGGLRDREE